jgi:energy-converting hydrogenase Eha subunit E
LTIILALVLVYMVMACQYESLRDPFVVMFSVPLAVIGVVLILFLTNTTFNVQTYIGCIMLGGIVVNNAILLVDHTNLLRRRDGFALRDAIEEAGRRRLRPILMTALTTVLGLLPLALGLGSEAQAPGARGHRGCASSTLITLLRPRRLQPAGAQGGRRPDPGAAAEAESLSPAWEPSTGGMTRKTRRAVPRLACRPCCENGTAGILPRATASCKPCCKR